jgi:hypothetical protein
MNNAKKSVFIFSIIIILIPFSLKADWFSYGGYYKNFSTVMDFPPYTLNYRQNTSLNGLVLNRLRLDADFKLNSDISFKLAYDIMPRIQDKSLLGPQVFEIGSEAYTYRAFDLDEKIYPSDNDTSSFLVYQNLDRAFWTISAPKFDLYIGRQAIAWGAARVINPTDVLAPFPYNELDIEYRIGIDAIRMRYPLGFMGELDLGYVFGDDFKFDQSAFFVRGKYYIAKSDVSLLMIGFKENLLVGFNFARNIGGAGSWIEAAYTFADALAEGGVNSDKSYFRISAGMDYSFGDGTYSYIEYSFNGAGKLEAEDYLAFFNSVAYREGSDFYMGKHYLSPGFSYQVTPLLTAYADAIINLNDPSYLLAPHAEYNIAENIYLDAGAYIGIGDAPIRTATGIPPVLLKSEFGSYPDIYYTSFKIYF